MMPLWVILLVAGVLVVAALVLIFAVHILDVHAEQQCAKLDDLTERSLQQNRDQTQYHYRCGESQLCCMCGSLRNRRSQVTNAKNISPLAKINPRQSTAAGLLQPLVDVACGRSSLSSCSFECLSELTNKRKRMASGLQGGWFNRRNFSRVGRVSEEPRAKGRIDASEEPVISVVSGVTATSASSKSLEALASNCQLIAGSESDLTSSFTVTTNEKASDSSRSSADAKTSSVVSSEGGNWNPVSQRRFVLEILMSPTNTGDGQGNLPRATGVRLKFETSSGAENTCQPQEMDAEIVAHALTSGLAHAACSTLQVGETSTGSMDNFVGANGVLSRVLGPVSKEGYTHPELGAMSTRTAGKCDLFSQDGSTAPSMSNVMAEARTGGAEDKTGVSLSGNASGQSNCPSDLNKRVSGSGFQSSVPSNALTPVTCKAEMNGNTLAASSSAKAKAKMGSCCSSSNSCTGPAIPGCGSSGCPTSYPYKYTQGQTSVSSPSDGLGSLRISIIDGVIKHKSVQECSKGVTAELASALAALKVDSIGGKTVGISLTISQGGDPSDAVGLSEKVDGVQEEEVPGDGSGSEQVVEDGVARLVPVVAEEDEVDVNKKEKKKKKNKGRRQKAKAAAVAAAAAGIEAQEQHVTSNLPFQATESSSMAMESEIGCICGIPKGGCHFNNCPYPFTSSGSMVQRKIKEQYDELVRANVSKTLTLAQVGRFTTCLVEAKSTLQQKSETIQRRFTIAKSLLSKADKSSFDRLCGQIYGLEIEQKKLEEDTLVYNRLQEQLKLSPAYQKMLEYGRTHFELQPNTGQLIEKVDSSDIEISFEELLAQEKKDSFWQKHGPARTSMQVN